MLGVRFSASRQGCGTPGRYFAPSRRAARARSHAHLSHPGGLFTPNSAAYVRIEAFATPASNSRPVSIEVRASRFCLGLPLSLLALAAVPAGHATPPAAGELRYIAYTTGYASLDNTPPGSTVIALNGRTGHAGGTGTFEDPITLAVGHSITNGKGVGDFAYGTTWYVPNLRKYFVAKDTCGDGASPQNGPCHTGYRGHVWLDLFVGASRQHAVRKCQESITDLHLVIQHPRPDYAVVPGPVFDGGCKQYGDTIVLRTSPP